MLRELAMAQAAPCSVLRVLRLPTQVRSSPVFVLLGAPGVFVHLSKAKGGPHTPSGFATAPLRATPSQPCLSKACWAVRCVLTHQKLRALCKCFAGACMA